MTKLYLAGKKIRLYFHTDLDGAIGANLIYLFSGAKIVKFVPSPFSEYRGKLDKTHGILNVFVDCRSANRDEDIRIDHHLSGEDEAYLKREGIFLWPNYQSVVSLIVHLLGIKINKQIIDELDKADSGKQCIFSKFDMGSHTINKILIDPGLKKEDYQNFEQFEDKIINWMEKGFAIEDLKDTPKGYEKKLEKKFGVIIEDIKKTGVNLIKIVHTPTHSSFLRLCRKTF